jgi:2-methylcitrate dehydratase PrpD
MLAATLPRNSPLAALSSVLSGIGNATALGLAAPMSAAAAALRNGALMHSLEYDGTHTESVTHAGSVVVPAALAVAEEAGASGSEFLRAFALSWEVFVRLGLAAPGRFGKRGFQFTAVGGPFAAALAAGLVMGLDAERITNALGIAGSQAGGLMEFVHDGATVKALHTGWPAHAGIIAARLAEVGMTGPATILEGPHGFYQAYIADREAPARLRHHLGTLGVHWHLNEAALKMHATCHYIQPFLECFEVLFQQGLDAREVASIHCEVPPGEESLICEPWAEKLRPVSAYQAKFSLPYALGALLTDGAVSVDTFEGPARPEVCAAAARVSWSPMADGDFPRRFGARLTMTTRSQQKVSAHVEDVRGTAGRPLAEGEAVDKFLACARRALAHDAPEQVIEAVRELRHARDVTALSAALRSVR